MVCPAAGTEISEKSQGKRDLDKDLPRGRGLGQVRLEHTLHSQNRTATER
jgi:hypothetical protein